MMRPIQPLLACALAVTVLGCASTPSSFPDRNQITEREIEQTRATNALELIERLRPFWLIASRGERSINLETTILVYQNQTALGGLEELRRIPVHVIRSVRALDAVEAGQLAGLGSRHVERAIVVMTHDEG